MSVIWTSLALLLVIEGALYALFPEAMQRMMRDITAIPPETLRRIGLGVCFVGFILVYFLQKS